MRGCHALAIFGLIFVLGIPVLPLSRWENEFSGTGHLVGYEVIWWAFVGLILLYVRSIEARPLTSIGFRALPWRDAAVGVATGILIVAGLVVTYSVILPALHLNESQQVNQLAQTPLWWRGISVIRAAVAEEIAFRGYAIERLKEVTSSLAGAATISCALFTFAHLGTWGWSHLILAGFGGVLLTVLYVWRRNLWANIIAHFIVDASAVLLS
jgi:uncharacterized protein